MIEVLAISVEFLHGTFRGDPDGSASTGSVSNGEWPPSPARLFAALVAADGTGDACRVTEGTELEWFERLPPPVIYADPHPSHQPILPRWVVRHTGSTVRGIHQEYVGRSPALSRAGVRVALRDSHVVYVWPDGYPAEAVLGPLRRRAARVGYFGASDSPVRLRVSTAMPPSIIESSAFVPDQGGNVTINVTQPGDLGRWDRMYAEWTERGASVSRLQFPALRHEAAYRSPLLKESSDNGETVAWMLLRPSVSGRRISLLTGLFKEAVLSHYERMFGEPPQILHGHGFTTKGYEIARYLALPDVGHRWSRGRIHGLALWMPPDSDTAVRKRARDAALSVRRLTGTGIDLAVYPDDAEKGPLAAQPGHWMRQSHVWVSAIPAIHERRGALHHAEITRWCHHAGLPAPVAFRSSRTPLIRGGIDLAPVEVNRPGRPVLPYSHVELWFDEAIEGPVVVGSGRQRGFGLCLPLNRQIPRERTIL